MMGNNNGSSGKQGAPAGYWPQSGAAPAYPVAGRNQQAYAHAAHAAMYPHLYSQTAYPTYAGNMYPQAGYDPPPPYSEAPYASQMATPTAQYGYQPAPQTTYVIPNAFDAGARFTGNVPPSVPPPPPGVAPNSAQLAAAQGQNVVLGQKQNSFWSGGGGGGYTFW